MKKTRKKIKKEGAMMEYYPKEAGKTGNLP